MESSIFWAVPSNLTLNQYYLIFKADNNNAIAEGSELDNTRFTLYIKDLANYKTFSSASVINTLIAVPSINLNYSIVNNGIADGLTSTTAFFWSSDNLMDAGDHLLKSISEPLIIMGDTTTESVNLVYPTPVIQFTYYLFCVVYIVCQTNRVSKVYLKRSWQFLFVAFSYELNSRQVLPVKLR